MQGIGLIALIGIYTFVIYRIIKNPTFLKLMFQNKEWGKLVILIILLGWLVWVTSLAVKNLIQ